MYPGRRAATSVENDWPWKRFVEQLLQFSPDLTHRRRKTLRRARPGAMSPGN